MKHTIKHPIAIICALVALLGLVAAIPTAANAQTKSKEKPKAASTTSKSKSKSTTSKANEAADDEKAAEAAQLKKANDMLKVLSSSKKSSLTKLLKSGKQEDLEALPGVGEKTAKAIIKARPLESSAHLILVKGIGEKTFKEIVDSRK